MFPRRVYPIGLGVVLVFIHFFTTDRSVMDVVPEQNQTIHRAEGERILLLITTHLSEQHIRYFDCCWPRLMERSKLMETAHILLYTNDPIYSYNTNVTQRIKDLFDKSPSVTYENIPADITVEEKLQLMRSPLQAGANFPMKLAFELNWFEGYDWVVRINPDVIIRNSTWMLDAMKARPNAGGDGKQYAIDAILHRCNGRSPHTDFFAFRPGAINSTDRPFSELINGNHEGTAKAAFMSIMRGRRYTEVRDAMRGDGNCRIKGPRSTVVHDHYSCKLEDPERNNFDDGFGGLVCDVLEGWDVSH